MKEVIIILSTVLLFRCNSGLPKYTFAENRVYSVPAKSMINMSLVLKDSVTRENVAMILNHEYAIAIEKKMEYHPQPTQVFIYVWDSEEKWKAGRGEWLAMISKNGSETDGQIKWSNQIVKVQGE